MIKYGIGVASGVAPLLAAVAWPGSASMASPVQVTGTAHQAARAAAGSAPGPARGHQSPLSSSFAAAIRASSRW